MQKLLKSLSAILLLFLTGVSSAFASGPFSPAAIINGTDRSINYLSQLFGQVGSSLSSVGTSQFVSIMFKMYNEGVLVLAGVWILYTIYDTLIKVTEKSVDSLPGGIGMKFIKISLGIVLVIPSATTGYSGAQDLTMFAVKQGVALADSTWNAALDYLKDGNVLFPSVTTQDGALASSGTTLDSLASGDGFWGTNNSSTSAGIPSVLNQLVCAITTTSWSSYSSYSLYSESGDVFTFNGTSCGSLSTDQLALTTSTAAGSILKQEAVSNLLSNLTIAANLFVCNINSSVYSASAAPLVAQYCNSNNTTSSLTGTAAFGAFNEQLSSTYTAYVTDLMSIENSETTLDSTTTSSYDTLVAQMQSGGWINVGAYYWAIAAWMQNNGDFGSLSGESTTGATSLSTLTNVTLSPTASSTNYLSLGSLSKTYSQAVACTSASNCTSLSDYIDEASSTLSTSGTATGSIATFTPDWDSDSSALLALIYGGISSLYNSFLTAIFDLSDLTPSADPLILLSAIGFKMINLGSTLISTILIIVVVMAAISLFSFSIFVGSINLIGLVFPLVAIVLDILKAIAMFLLLVGGTLAIYLPLYPWITWTFATVGWFVAVIEAMAAAPLVCINMTRPAGQELVGDARKALMLLLSVFLRPVLMVIGFCFAIMLSRVLLIALTHSLAITSLTLLVTNTTSNPSGISDAIGSISSSTLGQDWSTSLATMASNFSGLFNSIRGSTSGFALLIFQVLFIPTIFAIIGYIAFHIISFSFSLVFHLPNYVMTWVGGEVAASGIMGHLQQAVTDSKKAAQQGMQSGLKTVTSGMGAITAMAGAATNAASSEGNEEGNEESKGG